MRNFFILAGLLVPLVGKGAFPDKELIVIASRHQVPLPPTNALLVLAHTESRQVLGNKSTSRDPAGYSPAFLLKEGSDGSIVVLRGTEEQHLKKGHDQEPLWRPFSDKVVEPELGGYLSDFNRLSAFVCAVQLAARGDNGTAQRIWNRIQWLADIDPPENVEAQLKNPPLLLGRCVYDYLKNRVLDEPQNWPEVYRRMEALFSEFPDLKTEPRKAVFDGLAAALKAKTPAPDSTEALLISWSRVPRDKKHPNYFPSVEPGVGPEGKILLRGAEAVPELIALLNDRRITTQEVPHIMNAPSRVRLLGELAQQLLEQITGMQGWSPWRKPNADDFRAWLERSRESGEKETLLQSVFKREDGRITQVSEGPATILAQRFPEALVDLCEEFSKAAKPETQPFVLAKAIVASRLPKERKVEVLVAFAQRGSLEHQRAVLQYLAPLDPQKCSEILLPIIAKLPTDSAGPYWTCPEAALTHSVMRLEDDRVWREYLKAAKRSSIGLRLEMMNPMNYTYIGQTNRVRRLAFLAAFLNDESLLEMPNDRAKSKFSGPCAAFTYQRITVQDFAASKIASILNLPDRPDEFWTSAQWATLRQKVKQHLAAEKLPSFD